jgi:hypothetical protein
MGRPLTPDRSQIEVDGPPDGSDAGVDVQDEITRDAAGSRDASELG